MINIVASTSAVSTISTAAAATPPITNDYEMPLEASPEPRSEGRDKRAQSAGQARRVKNDGSAGRECGYAGVENGGHDAD